MAGFSNSIKYTAAEVSERSDSQTPEISSSTPRRRPWQTGFFKRLPWAGVLSILLSLGCAVAAVAIAVASDGKELDYFKINGYAVQPAVLLAIFATIANALLVFAFTQGATIHWWNMAFKGSTLKQLHSSYHYGSGLTAVFSSVTAFNTVALAGIMMPILLMDGPLLQRASNVVQRVRDSQANATVSITASPFMQGATGITTDHATEPSLYHPLFAKVLQQYENRDPITIGNQTCDGECLVEVISPGWDISCTEKTKDFRFPTQKEIALMNSDTFANGTLMPNSTYQGPQLDQTAFNIGVVYNYTLSPEEQLANHGVSQYGIEFRISYKSTPGDHYTRVDRTCKLGEALVKYPLRLQNGTAILAKMPISTNRTVQKVWRSYEDTARMGDFPSTLGGFWLALKSHYQTHATMYPVGGWYAVRTSNPVASQYLLAPNASAITTADISWQDPMDDLVLMANELAFRTALVTTTEVVGNVMMGSAGKQYTLTEEQPYIASPNLTTVPRTVQQQALVKSSKTVTVYETQMGWLIGGFVVMCLACLAIAPTYWGWWRLGRQVSMSPLEIARAFNAPIMQDSDPNATGGDLKSDLGDKRVCLAVEYDQLVSKDSR